jgi:hypothetical protein
MVQSLWLTCRDFFCEPIHGLPEYSVEIFLGTYLGGQKIRFHTNAVYGMCVTVLFIIIANCKNPRWISITEMDELYYTLTNKYC